MIPSPGSEIPMNIPNIKTFFKTEEPLSPPSLVVVPPPVAPSVKTQSTPRPNPPTPKVTPSTPKVTPSTPKVTSSTPKVTPPTQKPTPATVKPTPRVTPPPPAPQTPPATPPATTPPQTPSTLPPNQIITKIPAPPSMPRIDPPKDTCEKTCCSEDDSGPKLVLPVPLKGDGKSGSCERYAKLIIPVDGLNPDSLRSLTKGADTSELIRTVLQSLA
jgi:hypothetical protein